MNFSELELKIIQVALVGLPPKVGIGGADYLETTEIVQTLLKKINDVTKTKDSEVA